MMTCNVGATERTIRILLGIGLVLIGYFGPLPVWGAMTAYVVGAVALVTGAVQFCPLWKVLGVNTCAPKSAAKP